MHTKGPWKVVNRGTVPVVVHKGNLRMPIAVIGEVYMSRPERQANAKLIATAPELLAMLIKLENSISPTWNYWEETRSVIAKATGDPHEPQ